MDCLARLQLLVVLLLALQRFAQPTSETSSSTLPLQNVQNWSTAVGMEAKGKEEEMGRYECLQSNLGKLNGTWLREDIFGKPQEKDHWVFQPSCAKLEPFSSQRFCQLGLECKHDILFVGDSTTLQVYTTASMIFYNQWEGGMSSSDCPRKSRNDCFGHPACTIPKVREVPMYTMKICEAECGGRGGVRIDYIRHDHLVNHHGSSWALDLQCEHWKKVLGRYHYVFVSTGPHVPAMITHPFSKPELPENMTYAQLFKQEAQDLGNLFLNESKKGSVLIYQTGMWGIEKYIEDCNDMPNDEPVAPTDYHNYSWRSIPLLNSNYTHTLMDMLGPERFMQMDTADLFAKIVGCRQDPLHFSG